MKPMSLASVLNPGVLMMGVLIGLKVVNSVAHSLLTRG